MSMLLINSAVTAQLMVGEARRRALLARAEQERLIGEAEIEAGKGVARSATVRHVLGVALIRAGEFLCGAPAAVLRRSGNVLKTTDVFPATSR